jgi:hypothetical protein
LDVIDGARIEVADQVFTAKYFPLPVAEFRTWWAKNEPRLKADNNFSYYGERNDCAQKLGAIFPNNIYQDLYNVVTAQPPR